MKVNGKIIRHMDLVCISIIQELYTKATGRKTCKVVLGYKSGWITVGMKDPI